MPQTFEFRAGHGGSIRQCLSPGHSGGGADLKHIDDLTDEYSLILYQLGVTSDAKQSLQKKSGGLRRSPLLFGGGADAFYADS